jgi:hypothetical protein
MVRRVRSTGWGVPSVRRVGFSFAFWAAWCRSRGRWDGVGVVCVCVCLCIRCVCVCVCVCVCRGCCAPARRAGSLRRARRFLLLGFFNEFTDCRRSADLLIESRSRPQLAENSGFPRTSAYPAYSPVCLVHELSWRQLAPSDKQASGTA